MSTKIIKLLKLGRMRYDPCLQLQNQLSEKLKTCNSNHIGYLVIVEHEPVYTIGIRKQNYKPDLEKKLTKLGAEFKYSNRGGLITFHGPGQLIAYPIINLKYFKSSVRWYVQNLEYTILNLCKEEYNLNANTSSNTGVWIDNEKICAIGIRCTRYITTHGLALNCNTDLSWFNHIVPCGLHDKGVTSLSLLLKTNLNVDDVLPLFLKHFGRTFQCDFVSNNI
ncbi:putative lipoyltransferase 2, mitochondrial isoform X2 [Daktulosphaira vitifoliae]|uniref:putative lipoyltransferase 2, mitochondrial isoform X2 n=1 Tax=Daktulosphaira vitifoliae TaxID=58002 RepID=UPI0021AB0122|nr:putative lipoyltransferase 2, mitochondrial isoform X2 [Daktulosphaira vitifoliae]XP_050538891.1 putative lipoyltransferase 2, mitochondrial isoform X2 [Daktulosphaira vitifoliae]XP_050538892.1 putative lipoyltransferase 2, mitochondrial isoform X2 [Daktulosphaira vitifoliae]XP_050538893.1 putative lipoyltransferase 2, mitochondrial isoform X2 [Daktulosphaira vitifoliae]XP_050538894.1 putative lipoyltransferase 2, mitochondrial isoform X2 [Daktulosphaira vitifoliae]